MSSATHKKYSTIFSNLDANSYRAFRAATNKPEESKNNSIKRMSSSVEILKNENNIRIPFSLKTKRFIWQTDKFHNLGVQLKGDLKNYQHEKSHSRLSWDGLNNISPNNFPTFKPQEGLQKKMMRRLIENSATVRTITPTKDKFSLNNSSISYKPSKKMNYESNYKINSSGSITNLLNRTCNNERTYKKYSERLLASNNIFVPHTAPYKRVTKLVPLDEYKGNNTFAGIKYGQIDEVKYFNETNYMNMKRGIFNSSRSANTSIDKMIMGTYERDLDRTSDKSRISKAYGTFKSGSLSGMTCDASYAKIYVQSTKSKAGGSKATTHASSMKSRK